MQADKLLQFQYIQMNKYQMARKTVLSQLNHSEKGH